MTWAEWVASSYNTGGFYILSGNTITDGSTTAAGTTKTVGYNSWEATSSDTIVSGRSYVLGSNWK